MKTTQTSAAFQQANFTNEADEARGSACATLCSFEYVPAIRPEDDLSYACDDGFDAMEALF